MRSVVILISGLILHTLGALKTEILRFTAQNALPIGQNTWNNPDQALQPLQGEASCSPVTSLDSALLMITDFNTDSLLDNDTINGIGFIVSRGCSAFQSKE
jgi:hypothetical protein